MALLFNLEKLDTVLSSFEPNISSPQGHNLKKLRQPVRRPPQPRAKPVYLTQRSSSATAVPRPVAAPRRDHSASPNPALPQQQPQVRPPRDAHRPVVSSRYMGLSSGRRQPPPPPKREPQLGHRLTEGQQRRREPSPQLAPRRVTAAELLQQQAPTPVMLSRPHMVETPPPEPVVLEETPTPAPAPQQLKSTAPNILKPRSNNSLNLSVNATYFAHGNLGKNHPTSFYARPSSEGPVEVPSSAYSTDDEVQDVIKTHQTTHQNFRHASESDNEILPPHGDASLHECSTRTPTDELSSLITGDRSIPDPAHLSDLIRRVRDPAELEHLSALLRQRAAEQLREANDSPVLQEVQEELPRKYVASSATFTIFPTTFPNPEPVISDKQQNYKLMNDCDKSVQATMQSSFPEPRPNIPEPQQFIDTPSSCVPASSTAIGHHFSTFRSSSTFSNNTTTSVGQATARMLLRNARRRVAEQQQGKSSILERIDALERRLLQQHPVPKKIPSTPSPSYEFARVRYQPPVEYQPIPRQCYETTPSAIYVQGIPIPSFQQPTIQPLQDVKRLELETKENQTDTKTSKFQEEKQVVKSGPKLPPDETHNNSVDSHQSLTDNEPPAAGLYRPPVTSHPNVLDAVFTSHRRSSHRRKEKVNVLFFASPATKADILAIAEMPYSIAIITDACFPRKAQNNGTRLDQAIDFVAQTFMQKYEFSVIAVGISFFAVEVLSDSTKDASFNKSHEMGFAQQSVSAVPLKILCYLESHPKDVLKMIHPFFSVNPWLRISGWIDTSSSEFGYSFTAVAIQLCQLLETVEECGESPITTPTPQHNLFELSYILEVSKDHELYDALCTHAAVDDDKVQGTHSLSAWWSKTNRLCSRQFELDHQSEDIVVKPFVWQNRVAIRGVVKKNGMCRLRLQTFHSSIAAWERPSSEAGNLPSLRVILYNCSMALEIYRVMFETGNGAHPGKRVGALVSPDTAKEIMQQLTATKSQHVAFVNCNTWVTSCALKRHELILSGLQHALTHRLDILYLSLIDGNVSTKECDQGDDSPSRASAQHNFHDANDVMMDRVFCWAYRYPKAVVLMHADETCFSTIRNEFAEVCSLDVALDGV